MSPIPDAAAGYEPPMLLPEALYHLQNAYLSACIEVAETQEKYIRHETGADEMKLAYAKAETALGTLESYWATIDSQAKKEERKK